MAKRDFYEVLGVNNSSSPQEIKQAYRKLALKYHPDKNKGDKSSEEKFKEASAAYHVLSDKERKQNYDNFGNSISADVNNPSALPVGKSRIYRAVIFTEGSCFKGAGGFEILEGLYQGYRLGLFSRSFGGIQVALFLE